MISDFILMVNVATFVVAVLLYAALHALRREVAQINERGCQFRQEENFRSHNGVDIRPGKRETEGR